MCVMAAYVGPGRAAPILLDMLRREQGLAGGYYTGVATVADGRLYFEKSAGDVDALVSRTAVERLPGTIGIAHSRSPSGGGREWAHPFVDCSGRLAYIANGAEGQYRGVTDLARLANDLAAGGHVFRSAQPEPVGDYPALAGGDCVHLSDVLCHAIEAALDQANGSGTESSPDRLLDAAAECYGRYPDEITGICLHASCPDAMVAVRHNKPLELGRGRDGSMWLASSVTAFDDRVEPLLSVPSETGVVVRRDGSIRTHPVRGELIPVGPRLSAVAGYAAVERAVRAAEASSVADLLGAAARWWPDGVLAQSETVVFGALAELLTDGEIELWDEPTAAGGTTGPRTWAKWTGMR